MGIPFTTETLKEINFEEFKSKYRKVGNYNVVWDLEEFDFNNGSGELKVKLYQKVVNLINTYEKTIKSNCWEIVRYTDVRKFTLKDFN
ncbi:MAG TPA: hypothetical protein PK993_04960 [Clostridia bacterium]|jgi:hypothetical protein|nr:hypothetical protein [Clostridia bacterium]HQN48789.1 hypothetical protein [Caldisericia bacterium]HQO99998.1 hypothetical protein [Caldisericia bacterium]